MNSKLDGIKEYNNYLDLEPLQTEMTWDELEHMFQPITVNAERRAQSKINNLLLEIIDKPEGTAWIVRYQHTAMPHDTHDHKGLSNRLYHVSRSWQETYVTNILHEIFGDHLEWKLIELTVNIREFMLTI